MKNHGLINCIHTFKHESYTQNQMKWLWVVAGVLDLRHRRRRYTGVCGWTVGWIIKRYRNLVLATKKFLAASHYTISVFASLYHQGRRRVSIFGGAVVKKIIISYTWRTVPPSLCPHREKNGPCFKKNKRIFVIVHASAYPVSTAFQKRTGTPTRF